MARSDPPATRVAAKIIGEYGDRLHDKAICLTTPIPALVPLAKVEPRPALREFLCAYERRVAANGLYAHQADVVKALKKKPRPNIVMTTATGSGKSLAFWAWAFEILTLDPEATVVAAFPTQALLWGQAKRLANISEQASLIEYEGLDGASFAGTIKVGGERVPWSVWYGTSGCEYMHKHAQSSEFRDARLRLSTLDKVHWSLMQQKEASFLSGLAGMIIDEAHSWHGLSGANVRSIIDRLRVSMDVLGSRQPSFFLASATLASATSFAEDLTGVPAISFLEIEDRGAAKASLVDTVDVPELLAQAASPGLLRRYVLLIDPEPEPVSARDVLTDDVLGPDANVLCFVQNKFFGHRLRQDLYRALPDRDVIAYDGDLPAKERRAVEDGNR